MLLARQVLLCLLGGIALTGPLANPAEDSADTSRASGDERRLLALVNQERARRDAAPLAWDARLAAAARAHARELAKHRSLSHRFSGEPSLNQRLAAEGARFDSSGENVAESGSVESAHFELMHSPGHRANILNPKYDRIGIGIVPGGDNSYFTQDFTRSVAEHPAGELESIMFQELNRARARRHLGSLAQIERRELHALACEPGMNADRLVRNFPSAGWVVTFTGSQTDELPAPAVAMAQRPEARSVALGACYPPGLRTDGFTQFAVIAVFFR